MIRTPQHLAVAATIGFGLFHAPAHAADPPPGPAVLHAPPATAPQLEDAGGWPAAPLLVSGTEAYVAGEYLYQDWIYDDHGADTTPLPLPPNPEPGSDQFGAPTGDLVYPTDAATFRYNAADLLELRARTDGTSITYRLTLNTMTAGDVTAVAIGIDTDRDGGSGADDWGYGLGQLGSLGLEHVIVTWGTGAELDGDPAGVTAAVDTDRNQIEVSVPLEPKGGVWRHYAVVGLFDASTRTFRPVLEQPTATAPGGAHGTNPPPVFNVAFRFDEPMGSANASLDTPGDEIAEAATLGSRGAGYGHWREHAQAKALAARDLSAFHADIDFGRLARGDTEIRVGETGYQNRLYSSHLDLGEGVDASPNVLLGRVQPYALYIPSTYDGTKKAPLTVLLPATTTTYNLYAAAMPNMLRQLGEERGALVLVPEARGPSVSYRDAAELDVFEAMGDVLARYTVDRERITVGGYSRGGYGTYKLLSEYPDLFARGFAVVGTNGLSPTDFGRFDVTPIAVNLLHNPLLFWWGTNDELVPPTAWLYEEELHRLGYRHEMNLFPGFDHFALGILDEWGRGRDFLEAGTVVRAPERVVYRRIPEVENAALGLVHDHAFWVSGISVAAGAASGLVDVRSLALDRPGPVVAGILGAGTDPAPHLRRGIAWKAGLGPATPANALELVLEDVDGLTVHTDTAGLDAAVPIAIDARSNVAATLRLDDGTSIVEVAIPAGASSQTVAP